jgi:secretion/DNA translocation related TadE-like protein
MTRPACDGDASLGVAGCRQIAGGDCGSAALWMVGLAMVLWLMTAAIVLAGVAISARHRAATAADLAALSGAAAAARAQLAGDANGPTLGCAAARASAVANNATLDSCQVVGAVVTVTAAVATRGLSYLGVDSVSALARAGPA